MNAERRFADGAFRDGWSAECFSFVMSLLEITTANAISKEVSTRAKRGRRLLIKDLHKVTVVELAWFESTILFSLIISSYLWRRWERVAQDWKTTSKIKDGIISGVTLILGAEGWPQTALERTGLCTKGDVSETVPIYSSWGSWDFH